MSDATVSQLAQIENLWNWIWSDVIDPRGKLSLRRVIEALEPLAAELPIPDVDPASFLYLTLPRAVLDQPVESLLARPISRLPREGIRTVDDLLQRSEKDLLGIYTLGQGTVDDIKAAVTGKGWHLSPDHSGLSLPAGETWVYRRKWAYLRSRFLRLPVNALEWKLSYSQDKIAAGLMADAGIHTIGDLIASTPERIAEIPWQNQSRYEDHAGQRLSAEEVLSEVSEALELYGFSLSEG